MSHPQVVNVRSAPKGSYIYIGRAMPGRFEDSAYGNPFSHRSKAAGVIKVATRDEAVESYLRWLKGELVVEGLEFARRVIINNISDLADALDRGCKLGCWCAPQRCHGEALIEYVEGWLGRKIGTGMTSCINCREL